ncbi:hypothetical protein TWF694_007396 [Orbilia ellipsospora]|uniref:Uncharacterized protein n=1 Tax=Orbilia ellipsospora TaxID=2528407 RepID=A0AAV9XHM3_9PEZI
MFVLIYVEKDGKQKQRWSLERRTGGKHHFVDRLKDSSPSERPSNIGIKRKLGDTDFTVVNVEKRDGNIKRWLVAARNPTCSQVSGETLFFLDYAKQELETKRPKSYLPRCHFGKCTEAVCVAKCTLLALLEAPRK